MDLLGSKAAAISEPQRYREMIHDFQSIVENLYTKDKRKQIEVYVFSDCAYFESNNFDFLLRFLRNLREKLLFRGIFFNAAVCEGKLGAKMIIDKESQFSMVDFQNSQVVKVYSLQSCFSGAGIYIDPDLMNVEEIREHLCKMCVRSIYMHIDKFTGKKTFLKCIDVKFGKSSLELLQYILNMYVKCYVQDKRASRYYYTLFTTYIAEQSIDVFLKDDMKYIKEIIRIVGHIEDFQDRAIILLKLIDRIYTAKIEEYKEVDSIDLNEKLLQPLDYIYKNTNLCRLYNISEYSREIINDRNKALLSEFCFWKKVNDCD